MITARLSHYFQRRFRILTPIFGAGLLLPIFSGWMASTSNIFAFLVDLATHWQWLYLVGLVMGSLFLFRIRKAWGLLLLLVPLPWLTAFIQADRANPTQSQAVLMVVAANVRFNNPDIAPLVRWLTETSPDLVVLQEFSPRFTKGLNDLSAYPYHYFMPRDDPFGMAVLSKHPLSIRPVIPKQGQAYLEGDITWHGRNLRLVSFHPMPPISVEDYTYRNAQLKHIASESAKYPMLIAGDFNASPWSNNFYSIRNSGLKRATDLTPTWPAFGLGWFGIPVDMVLVSREWRVLDQKLGPDIGSDHLPVQVKISLEY